MHQRCMGLAFIALALAGCDAGITLPGSGKTEVSKQSFHCDDGQRLDVRYYDNDTNQLAVVKKGEEAEYVLVNVIAASGARYDGNIYQWWTKGDSGTFSNLMEQKSSECNISR